MPPLPVLLIPWFKLQPWQIPVPIVGELAIQPFGVLAATAIVLGARLAEWRAERTGMQRELMSAFLVRVVAFGLIAAAVLNVLVYEPAKVADIGGAVAGWLGFGPKTVFPYPGLSSFGGFFGGAVAAFWFSRARRISLLALADVFCFAFPFAWIFARAGCFVVHDHPGVESDFVLAVANYNGEGVARHDLGLYEVLWSFVMTPVVLWLGNRPRPLGFFAALVPIAYASVRFFLDFLRETPLHGGDVRYFGLTPGHYASLAMLLAGVAIAARVAQRQTGFPLPHR
jgi:phosphatidylglycerol:prolipoprotein diacylglycerol transferase